MKRELNQQNSMCLRFFETRLASPLDLGHLFPAVEICVFCFYSTLDLYVASSLIEV